METDTLLAIDQGTTSTRAIAYTPDASPITAEQCELPQGYPKPGWVEHDAGRIRDDAIAVTRAVLGRLDAPPRAVGLTNQRETTVVWDRATGEPIHPAIVWQDRRTADRCRTLREEGREPLVRERTGLLLDPYFSGTKLAWILDHVEGARAAAERGDLAFGTIDTWLLWCLTGGRVHATDASNASRTLLFDIHGGAWDDELLELFDLPRALLPEVRDSAGDFGETDPGIVGAAIPIRGVAGDQQAASVGQAVFSPGDVKCTYGTGAFALMNTGDRVVDSANRLLSTVAWRLDGRLTYALEGSIFMAGATVQWLRDALGIIEEAADTEGLARSLDSTGGVYLVPAFVGLGAPHWDAGARGAIVGLTRDAGRAHIARAALEAVAYQTRELLEAMERDGAPTPPALRVDGGLSRNGWAMQFLSDTLGIPVERPEVVETTALGAAFLAGLGAGVYRGFDEIGDVWRRDARWEPAMGNADRATLFDGWKRAVARVRES